MNNKMRRILALVLVLVLACSMLTACGSKEEASETGVKKVKVGVINTGTAETMAWTRAHKEGVDYLKEKPPLEVPDITDSHSTRSGSSTSRKAFSVIASLC